MTMLFFFNRRSGTDRRKGKEQRQNPRLDLSHKRRRKSDDRRSTDMVSINNSREQLLRQIDPGNPTQKH
ncbi:MAG: hypothetical protein WCY88_04175 [Spongiibacteraceae bacterium]